MGEYASMPGRYPAVVKEYVPARRTCRVEVPGLTDGADVFPEAEIEYPIGDKSKAGAHATEIEIVPGDAVWVAFIGGDPRFPIITGWRNPQVGNDVDWRRWHHANIEAIADQLMKLIAGGDVLIQSGTKITGDAPDTHLTGNVLIDGTLTINGASVTHAGVNIGKTHTHLNVTAGTAVSGIVKP